MKVIDHGRIAHLETYKAGRRQSRIDPTDVLGDVERINISLFQSVSFAGSMRRLNEHGSIDRLPSPGSHSDKPEGLHQHAARPIAREAHKLL